MTAVGSQSQTRPSEAAGNTDVNMASDSSTDHGQPHGLWTSTQTLAAIGPQAPTWPLVAAQVQTSAWPQVASQATQYGP